MTTRTAARGGTAAQPGRKPRKSAPARKGECGDEQAVREHGHATAEEHGGAVCGRGEQRAESAEPPFVRDGHRHAVHGRHRARLRRVADDVEVGRLGVRVLPELREEDQLEERASEHRRDVHRRADPVEQPAVGDHAADEERAQPAVHVSESVARARAARSKMPNVTVAIASEARPRMVTSVRAAATHSRRAPRGGERGCPSTAAAATRSGGSRRGGSTSRRRAPRRSRPGTRAGSTARSRSGRG